MRKKRKTESLSNLQSSSNSSETSRKLKGKAEPHDDDESEYEFDEQAFRRELNITDEMDQAMQTFQEEMTLLKAVTEESFKRLCKMKEDEITIEEQLVENETHPEFQRLIAAAEEKASKRRRLLEYKRKLEENSILESYEAQLKLAHDSLLDSRRRIRSKVMTKVSSERYKLMAEYESTMNKNPTPSLTISPAVTRQRKEIAMYQSHSVSLIPITEWAQEQIEKLTSALHDSPAKSKKKMVDSDEEDEDDDNAVKAEGKPNLAVIGTAACTSATEGEKDDDIKFIKLLSEYESHSILVE
ncbi:hypothetical protein HK098_002045 [Nowakowskiella sp. JEL0407]|nr:hypothetical protein HK098_002045 [Nowakowskiella sp. JEL0407]